MATRWSGNPESDRSLNRAVKDGMGQAVLTGIVDSYMSAYAVLLGLTAAQIAIVAAFPGWIGSFIQVAGAWLARQGVRRKTLILAGSAVQIAMLPTVLVLPWQFPAYAYPILIACAAIYHAGNHLMQPNWISLIGDHLPEQVRGRYFGRRTSLAGIVGFAAMALAGGVLHWFEAQDMARIGFAVIFAIGGLGRLYSLWQLSGVADPGLAADAEQLRPDSGGLRRLWQSNFFRYSLSIGLMFAAVSFASPFFAVYMLRELHFTYLEFMGNMAASAATQALLMPVWGRVRDMRGNRLVIIISGALIPLVPVVWVFTPNYWALFFAQVITGAAWSGYTLAATTFLYDTVPPARRTLATAVHTVLSLSFWSVGAFAAAWLTTRMPTEITLFGETWSWGSQILPMFALSAVLRGLVAVLTLPRLKETRS
ncbi:MAG: MFS transporter [Alphaproteobacteria bacterium]|nr:MFS transporter [Alphaproteobacteria bacterium]